MAYGGTVDYVTFGPEGQQFANYCRIDGLTLDDYFASPPDIANGDTGQLTTGVPLANQTAIPAHFGRGRGNWRHEDSHLVLDSFQLLIDPSGPPGFVVPATVLYSPQVIDGNLVLTHQNIQTAGLGGLQLRVILLYHPPVVVYAKGGGLLW